MWRTKWREILRRSGKPTLFGSIAVAALTYLSYKSHLDLPVVGPLYLLVVVIQSLSGDYLSAAIVSILAVANLDYFFAEPRFSLRVSHPLDLVALVSFLGTALVITKLVSRVRREARLARLQTERMDHLYELAQQALGLEPETAVGERFLELFLGVFGTRAVCLFDSDTTEMHSVGAVRSEVVQQTREAFIRDLDVDNPASDICIRCFRVAGRVTGAMGFEGLENPELTAGPLVSLAAALQERTRAFRRASEAAAATQAEVYRTAILDALAHEFKTPLATIMAAAGGLSEAGPLNREQRDLAGAIESEVARLGSLTSRMLRVARLDREEVKPRFEATDVNSLLGELVYQYSSSPDRRFSLATRGRDLGALADPELLRLAISQLLDNACKYSPPGSSVEIDAERQGDLISVRVSNTGTSIPLSERNRIFERFYRGKEVRRFTSGSGLGLYVARKIALAHGGDLQLDASRKGNDGVTFRLTIPQAKIEVEHAAAVL
jgi:two-component system sensor histidine kinase KdpD